MKDKSQVVKITLILILVVASVGIAGLTFAKANSSQPAPIAVRIESSSTTSSSSSTSPSTSSSSSSSSSQEAIKFVDPLLKCTDYTYARGKSKLHSGIDLSKAGGCPINAIADGTVIFAGFKEREGFNIKIEHSNGFVSIYNNAKKLFVKKGDKVTAGQKIMQMGCTGYCTGTHLHLGLTRNGKLVDPAKYVPLSPKYGLDVK